MAGLNRASPLREVIALALPEAVLLLAHYPRTLL